MSSPEKPKQFLKLFPHPRNPDHSVSMIQRVYAHLEALGKKDLVSIVTTKELAPHVYDQLLNINVHVLPYRKETFGSVAFAAQDVAKRYSLPPSEPLLFLPVDHYTDENFYIHALNLEMILRGNTSAIGLLGISPTYPSTSYGYIQFSSAPGRNLHKAYQFREKPGEKEAQMLYGQSVWNAGVFMFTLETASKIIPFLIPKLDSMYLLTGHHQ